MNPSEKYDIEVRAFHIVFGIMAPGKDSPAAAGPTDMELRERLWSYWMKHDGVTIHAMMRAFEESQA